MLRFGMKPALRRACARCLLAAAACIVPAQAQAQAPAPEDPLVEARALLERAGAVQGLGFRQMAIEDLERAAQLVAGSTAGRTDARALAAAIDGALGQAYLRAGMTDKARQKLEAALVAARAERALAVEAAVLNDLGHLHEAAGKRAEALAAHRDSARAAREARLPLVFAAAATSAGPLWPAADRAAADALLQEAEKLLAGAPDSREADFARIRISQVLQPTSLERAHALLREALRRSEARGDALAASYALGYLADLYAGAGRDAEALALSRRAAYYAQQASADESLYRWSWQSARLLAKAGERDAALAAYRRALTSLQAVRQDLIHDLRAGAKSWRGTVGPLYLEYADQLLRRNAGEILPQARLVEARNTIEQLKAVELEDYFQDECVAGQLARTKDIDRLEARTAVVYPVVLADRVEMLVGLADGIHQVTLAVNGAALTEQTQGFRRMLEKRTTNQYLPFSRRLYTSLFAPLEPLLAKNAIDTVVFIPDGPLRGIPVAALNDGKAFLIERYAFATAPGLTLVEPRPIAEGAQLQILVNGITEAVQNYPALPFVEDELASLKEQFAGGVVLRDGDFKLSSLEKAMRGTPYTIVHIASHGEFDSNPKKSFVLTYDGRLDMDGLEQMMRLARFREDPIELLTLSACRTAAGDERAALGLAGVAVKAGARSALATLWYVNDQASGMLIADFYRGLAKTSKAKALQQAQRELLADARFRHPIYWAPFLLIGNWL